ncbi:hypothetical protein K6Y31_13175 [Motilimonas cestriensis]|uniref:Uncharacterized protein n=1 Tax=Motilimonas cestriensis TaxID=2742685 RepID=A0ABS8WBT6_9GAMM|nr:hypothetical protein [Motilimonas cestriensis]MCE2595757.1 hypothetical protein [Motilimonas cestriensis]
MKYLVLMIMVVIAQPSYGSSTQVENYLNSSRKFEALIKKETATGKLPRTEDKAMAKVFNELSKSQSAITSETYSLEDFTALLEVCGKANQFGMKYLLHEMNSVVIKTDPPQVIQEKVVKLMSENSIKYQNELSVFYPFLVDCLAIQSSLTLPFWESLPLDQRTQVRKDGLIQVRKGVLQLYAGVLTSLGDSQLKLAFKESLLESATQAAPVIASLLSLDSRNVVLNMLSQYSKRAPKEYLERFKVISREFGSKDCNEICQL